MQSKLQDRRGPDNEREQAASVLAASVSLQALAVGHEALAHALPTRLENLAAGNLREAAELAARFIDISDFVHSSEIRSIVRGEVTEMQQLRAVIGALGELSIDQFSKIAKLFSADWCSELKFNIEIGGDEVRLLRPQHVDVLAQRLRRLGDLADDGAQIAKGLRKWGEGELACVAGRAYDQVGPPEVAAAFAHLRYLVTSLISGKDHPAVENKNVSGDAQAANILVSALRSGLLRPGRVLFELGSVLGGKDSTRSDSRDRALCARSIEPGAVESVAGSVREALGSFDPFSVLGVALERPGDPLPGSFHITKPEAEARLARSAVFLLSTDYDSRQAMESDATIFRGWDTARVPMFSFLPPSRIAAVFIPENLGAEIMPLIPDELRAKIHSVSSRQVEGSGAAISLGGISIEIPDYAEAISSFVVRHSTLAQCCLLLHASRF
jgi:hypothetical protein